MRLFLLVSILFLSAGPASADFQFFGPAAKDVEGNSFSVGTSTFVVRGGKVGVGTTNPSAGLEVATGTFKLPRYTTAQANLMSPGSAGELIYNSTLGCLCVSTGTGLSAWTRVWSSSAAVCR